jgi:hypothetical protein
MASLLIRDPAAILATIGISRAAGSPVTYFGVTAASSITMPADLPPALAAWAAISSIWVAASFAMAATSSSNERKPLTFARPVVCD